MPFGEAPNISSGASMSRGSLACAFSARVVLVLRRLVSLSGCFGELSDASLILSLIDEGSRFTSPRAWSSETSRMVEFDLA